MPDRPHDETAQAYDIPWNYGRYRVVITRRVTEEEQISLEAYEPTREDAITTYTATMASMRAQMIAHNEQVILAYQTQIGTIERKIENKAEELAKVTEEVDALIARRVELEHPELDSGGSHEDA